MYLASKQGRMSKSSKITSKNSEFLRLIPPIFQTENSEILGHKSFKITS